jgi:WD40 repeat protein
VRRRPNHAHARLATATLALVVLAACTSGAAAGPSASPDATLPASSTAAPREVHPFVVLRVHHAAVTHLAWSPDGKLLASSAGWFDSRDTTVRLWRPDGSAVAVLRGNTCGVLALAWSPDGRRLASGSCGGKVILWRRNGASTMIIAPGHGAVMGLASSPDGRTLATASVEGPSDNTIDLWSMPSGVRRATLHTRFSGGKFLNVGWSNDGRLLAGGAIDYHEWRADGTHVFSTGGCAHCTPAWGFGWSSGSTMWATGNESGDVHVYRTDGSEAAHGTNPYGNVDVLAWSPDGKVLAAANILWTIDGGEFHEVGTFGGGRMTAVEWSPDGSALAGGLVGLPDVPVIRPDGTLVDTLVGHGEVASLAWSPDGAIVASGSSDRAIRLYRVTP